MRTSIALDLPAGMGKQLAEDVKTFWLTTKRQLNQRFRSEHYQTKVEAIKNEISLREEIGLSCAAWRRQTVFTCIGAATFGQ